MTLNEWKMRLGIRKISKNINIHFTTYNKSYDDLVVKCKISTSTSQRDINRMMT